MPQTASRSIWVLGGGSSYEEPPGGGLQLRNRLHSSESSDGGARAVVATFSTLFQLTP